MSKQAKRKQRWGTCPVCLQVRRYTVKGEMINHNVWVPGFEYYTEYCTEDYPYGYMTPCQGSGKPFLPDVTNKQKTRKNANSRERTQAG